MPEQKNPLRGLTDHVVLGIRSIIDDESSPLNDFSVSPPDSRSHLADHQIHRYQIDALCQEVSENWPDVQSIECGVYEGKYPYIALRIVPYDDANAVRHDAVVQRLTARFPEFAGVSFYCLGEAPPHAVSAATPLYRRVA